ncbi:MAG: NAD(P)/FAD-dependent oxidoreductase [Anaerolineales bacterium]|nr:NAD(P)/FAD-dependent oxidoreductase [Anaerolineales bacterium]MCX7609596.1 NAD(P)/FAD-dependent oxidoreductase [Anaerolineales bacterium]
MPEDVVIIGAGPAGLTAAIQLRRYGLRPRLFEARRPGGLLWNANLVENYPGFPGGIPGPALARLFLEQATAVGVEITLEAVTTLDWTGSLFRLQTSCGVTEARAAIVATGTRPRPLTGFDTPEELQDRIAYEVADWPALQGERIVIIGGGDAAFDYALNLARQNFVIILNRSAQVKCLPLLWERASACRNIAYYANTVVQRLLPRPDGRMTVECFSPQGMLTLTADRLLGAIGREPQKDFLAPTLQREAPVLEACGLLYFVGDLKNGLFRQTAIAAGDGLRAAMHLYSRLQEMTDESACLDREGRNCDCVHC